MQVNTPYIFMSHSSKNNAFTQKLTDDLQAAHFNVWVDLEALRDGDRWVHEIQTALENCHAIVVIMSKAARESEWVERETLMALDLRKPLFIARIEDVPLPLQLITRQFTDFTQDYPVALQKLIEALNKVFVTPAPIIEAPIIAVPEDAPSYSADPNENNFFAYLEQIEQGDYMALIARELYQWAKHHADSIEFSGKFNPAYHVKVKIADKEVTVFSLLAYMRNPGVQIPLDYLGKYAPYTDLAERTTVLKALSDLLQADKNFTPDHANKRPTLTLTQDLDTAEELEKFKEIVLQIIMRLREQKPTAS